jgi:Cu2+-exporting ATPase
MSLRHRNQQSGAVLARLLPEWVQRVRDGAVETVLASELQPGDRVRVPPGEPFPADGEVLAGATEVNEALLTGESFPRAREAGDAVIAGSINLLQPVDVRVTATGLDSTVSALGRLLEKARSSRSGVSLLAERIASRFVLGVLLLATTIGLWWLLRQPDMALQVTLAVLVVSCPCALSLAAPSAVAAASRALLKRGVILTRGDAIERLASVDSVVFDKTGTLTSGQPEITRIALNPGRPGWDRDTVLQLATSLESASAHPLASAFHSALPLVELEQVDVAAGQGVAARVDGKLFRIGSRAFTQGAGAEDAEDRGDRGSVWLADESGWLAEFQLRDALRDGAAETVRYFSEQGLESFILSGDSRHNVEAVARELGIGHWQSALDPARKLAALGQLKASGRRLLMVGDGVNDAPVLAAADVSIAVQGGSELANSAADMILAGRSLGLVRAARELALRTRRIIAQNISWAVLYNVTMIPLAATGLLQPWMAAIGMSASSLLVVLNAARIGRGGPQADAARVSQATPEAA